MKRKIAKRALALALSASMIAGGSMSAVAATTDPSISDREIKHKTAAKNIAAQGMVLLENKEQTLPISGIDGTKVALFGQGVYNTIKGGTGSGAVNQRNNVTVRQGFENAGYNIVNAAFIDQMESLWRQDGGGSGGGMWGGSWTNERTYADVEGAVESVQAAAQATDTAIYVIARNSGEGSDRKPTAGDYLLSADEEANLTLLGKTFDKVIVVLNVGGIIDTKFFDEIEGLDAMLLMSQAGMTGGDAVVEVLNGTVNPSGKLTDTWPMNFDDNPSSAGFADLDGNRNQEVYNDDIFVGYRYYDTFGVDVSYEFGYGDSYTDFAITTDSVKADKDKVTVTATVKNTGAVSGKEVVEVYFSAPDGKLDKPYQELAGYAKTDELAPGASQTLTITFDTIEMGSYDVDQAAYIMEDGDYIIRVGNSSRNTHVAAKLNLAADQITEQYSHLMPLVKDNPNITPDEKYPELDPMTTEGATPITYRGEAAEIAGADTLNLDFNGYEAVEILKENEDVTVYTSDTTQTEYLFAENTDGAVGKVSRVEKGNANSSDYKVEYNEVVKKFDGDFSQNTLMDVYNKDITVEQFVSGMSMEELAELVNGHSSDKTVQGVAGATWRNDAKGIVPVNLSDGPAGLRITQKYTQDGITYYQYATAWPIGTLIAQTWDTEQIYAYGEGVGKEMEEFGIGCWLAPGMNIHRNALCGRNFEYYSEDPLVVGVTGTAATLGVQSSKGVGVTIKHYAVNSQETNRNSENNTVSERALREIYLKGFEMVVKQAQPMAIMTSYNQNNGRPAADDYDLCDGFTRNEWGYKGLIMTDWGGGQSVPMYEMHAGNDLVCPGKGAAQIIRGFKADPDWNGKGYVNMTTVFYQDENYDQTLSKEVENWGAYELALDGSTTISTSVRGDAQADPSLLDERVQQKIDEGYATMRVASGWGGVTTTITYKVNPKSDSLTNTQVISLGDLHKAAINICNFIMASTEFANENGLQAKALNETNAALLKSITSGSKSAVVSTVANSLTRLISFIEGLDKADFAVTDESWTALQTALTAAKKVAADEAATDEQLQAAVISLTDALAGLELAVTKVHLETAIKAADELLSKPDDFVDVAALRAVVNEVRGLLADKTATQEAVDAAAIRVLDEMAKVVYIADIKALQSLVDSAEALLDGPYTGSSLDELKAAIDAAKDVIANKDRTDDEITDAYLKIIDAIANLKLAANKAALKAMIEKAEAVLANKDAYVASSLNGLTAILADAKVVYNDENVSQKVVDETVETLTLKLAEARLYGDVTLDGKVNTNDSVALLRYAAERDELSAEQLECADVNFDGKADTSDAVRILQYAAEKIAAF